MYASATVDRSSRVDAVELAARGAAVGLALVASSIHASLGSLLYTLNAVGFAVLATALIVPLDWAVGRSAAKALRTIVRLATLGFALATITGWVLIGARIALGYEATAVEAAIAVLMAVSIVRSTGGPAAVVRELLTLVPAPVRRSA